jgi:hypothetical protein
MFSLSMMEVDYMLKHDASAADAKKEDHAWLAEAQEIMNDKPVCTVDRCYYDPVSDSVKPCLGSTMSSDAKIRQVSNKLLRDIIKIGPGDTKPED